MSDFSALGFGKFIPGFDFLQNLGKAGSATPGLPPFAHWVAPTVSVEEIEKRIEELKAVQFWLEQNSKALGATVQALEVQKMTLSTLQGMNVNLSEIGKAFSFASTTAAPASAAATTANSNLSDWPMSAAGPTVGAEPPSATPQPAAEAPPQASAAKSEGAQAAGMATAMQWWGALTQQFQQIAQQAMQDPVQQQALLKATQMSTELAQTAVKTASEMVRQAVVKTAPDVPASKRPSHSTAAKKAAATPTAKTVKKAAAPASGAVSPKASADTKKPKAAAKSARVAVKKTAASKARAR